CVRKSSYYYGAGYPGFDLW
nr:immunoglobulin heavy chain junction region [Macaca mulatta]MOX38029.1 immunoglobulin heavy chain junction region [Macaca mulatta]MOX38206.1 immunoglobulin heavy chain junction region [Macaca mulatta]MOX38646.1 immunoglobulin heavy chain junction region [Macaca mulatta]MOX39093.1 immunoglobulin heavy chain junction region [Macaca mulatta]